jgi:class 3 adenylate cyclase/tetratricopeptide (TPR) repeat protein
LAWGPRLANMPTACPQCGEPAPPDARFCAVCGAALAGCPTCGSAIPAAARFCPSCGRAVIQDPPAEERKVVTVLFADLVGSTAMAEGRDPERVGRILGAYASAVREVIESWGGSVEKYIGDAVVGAFGIPATHEDDPARALHAALEIHARLEALNAELEPAHGVRLTVRIGLNTGDVLAATAAGLDQRFMAGDVVNVAARLEQAAEPGTVLAAARTVEGAGGAFSFASAVALDLKGKGHAVQAQRLLGPRAVAAAATDGRLVRLLQAPLTGRDRELRLLEETLADIVEIGHPRFTLIFGPAGIGKSRLVREFLERAAARFPVLIALRGRCLAAGRGITYWALGEIVREACGITLDEAGDEALAKLRATTEGLFQDHSRDSQQALDVEFAMATTAGIRIQDNPLDRIRPIEVAAALGRAWPRFVSAQARRAPTVLLVEDLHWADEQLLEMLQNIVRRSAGPVLVIATARPEFAEDHPDFGLAGEDTNSISLPALREADAEQMAGALLGSESVPPGLRAALLDRAEGNPFFLEQLVGGLIDAGALERRDGAWRFESSARAGSLPDTIQGVLAARVDRLSGPEKRALQEAAVVGRTFWPPALVVSMDGAAVGPALNGLEAKNLIVVRDSSSVADETEFAFKHALVRDVAYAGIPLARRARSHARVAGWLEGLTSRGDEALLELIAHHYRAALLGEGSDLAWADESAARDDTRVRAFPALTAAGAAARSRNATERGLELHQAALALAVGDQERARAFEELGDDHGWSYHGDPSTEAWDQALELWRRLGDDESCARVCLKAARHTAIYWGGFSSRPPGETVDRYLDEGLERARQPLTRAWLLALQGLARSSYTSLGEQDPRPREVRIKAAEEAAAIARELDNPDVLVLALRSLGGLYLDADRPADALALAEQLLAMVDRVEALRDRLINTSLALAQIMDLGGDFERALELARDTRLRSVDLSAHERMHGTYFEMAALYRLGRWQEILPLLDLHLAAFAEETVDMNCPFTRGGPVIGALVLDQLGRSADAATASESIVPNNDEPGLVEAWMAERALLAGQPGTAREIAQRTIAFGRGLTIEQPPYELPVLVDALASLSQWDELEATLPAFRARAANVAWLAPAVDRAEAGRLAARGDTAGAESELLRALDAYRRLGMSGEVATTLERLADLDPGDEASTARRAEAAAIRRVMTGPKEITADQHP